MSATLQLKREVGFAASSFAEDVLKSRSRRTCRLAREPRHGRDPLEPGRHDLVLRKGRYSSRTRTFDVAAGEFVHFRCNGARIWPTYVASIVKPNLGISLRRE